MTMSESINTDSVASVIEELKGIRAALRGERKIGALPIMLQDVLSSVPLLIVDMDSGKILYATEEADDLFGYIPGELAGKDLHVLIPKELRDRHREHLQKYREWPRKRRMGIFGMDLMGLHRDGHTFHLAIGLVPRVVDEQRIVIATIFDADTSVEPSLHYDAGGLKH